MASNYFTLSSKCYLCVRTCNSNQMTLIFGQDGEQKKLTEKINLYTPFKINETDVSKCLCSLCQNNLDAWDSYIRYCTLAQEASDESGCQLTDSELQKSILVPEVSKTIAENSFPCSVTPLSKRLTIKCDIKTTALSSNTHLASSCKQTLSPSNEIKGTVTDSKVLPKDNNKAKGTYCCALWCNNNFGRNPKLSLFRIPKDKLRALQWLTNAGREDILQKGATFWHSKYLCEQHFTENMFMNSKRNKLVWNAIPTIFSHPPQKLNKESTQANGKGDIDTLQEISKPTRKILPKTVPMIDDLLPALSNNYQDPEKLYEPFNQQTIIANDQTEMPLTLTSQNDDFEAVDISGIMSYQLNSSDTADCHSVSVAESNIGNAKFEMDNLYLEYPCEESNEKRYPCTFCGEMFLFKNSLLVHQTTYHSYSCLFCEFCGKELDKSINQFTEHKCDHQITNNN